MNNDIVDAHKYCEKNKEMLSNDKKCGCFYCLKIFNSKEISDWLEDGTALCPYCLVDSVIGESSNYPITKEFLEKMQKYWF